MSVTVLPPQVGKRLCGCIYSLDPQILDVT